MSKKIGITGGIGSGKSVVCSIFSQLHIPIYYADERARNLMNTSPEVRREVTMLFGSEAYTKDGKLNRNYLSGCVFEDTKLLEALNAIVHPRMAEDFIQWNQAYEGSAYILKEAALIFETGMDKQLDAVIVVSSDLEDRIQRVMKRDGVSRERVEKIISQQWPEERKLIAADYIIRNNGSESLIEQVLIIHQQLIAVYL